MGRGILEKSKIAFLKFMINLFLSIVTLCAMFPLLWVFWSSFKTSAEFSKDQVGLPKNFLNLQNYFDAFRVADMAATSVNTAVVTICAVAIICVFSFLVAYFINRYCFKGRKLIYGLFLLGMMFPVHSFLVPVYVQFSKLGMLNSLFTLILVDAAFAMPLSIVLIENFLREVPLEVEEAAIIDGASLWQRLCHVSLPMSRPIMATLLIIQSLWTWNEYPFALSLINSSSKRTLPVAMSNFRGDHSIDYTPMFAGLVLVSLPILIVYSIFSKKIMEGMTAGAVKG